MNFDIDFHYENLEEKELLILPELCMLSLMFKCR